MDRKVTDDDITLESHKRIAQNQMTSHPRIEMMNDAFGCSRATQLHMEDLRLLIKKKYIQVQGLNASRLLVKTLDG